MSTPATSDLPPTQAEPSEPVGGEAPAAKSGIASEQTTVIEAGRAARLYWSDLWRYRELLYFLAWRDVAVRYKQTFIGIAWAVIRPVLTMMIMVIIFGRVAGLDKKTDGPAQADDYPLLVMCGMLAWQLFSSGFSSASESLLGSSNLISKVYFPRLLIPMSSIAVSLVDFLVTLPIIFMMMLYYGTPLTWRLACFPLFVALALLCALSLGIWLAALNVRYRDVRHIVPFIVQFGLYVTPVGYSLAAIKKPEYRWLLELNPASGLIEGFRWSLMGQNPGFTLTSFAVTIGAMVFLLYTGISYFRHTERTFADVI